MSTQTPPYRAEHVGSLLRPPELKRAARRFHAGEIGQAEFEQAQDEAIREAVAMQENVGLQNLTDGEFRRVSWYGGFVDAVDGLTNRAAAFQFQDDSGHEAGFEAAYTEGPIARTRSITVHEYTFVKSLTQRDVKVTMPAPSAIHFFCVQDPVDRGVYPEDEAYWADLVAVYGQELAALSEAGAGFVQFDECPFIMMADPKVRAVIEGHGIDPEGLIDTYFDAMKAVLDARPAGMRTAMHLCRGNYKGHWIASGGYDRIAERLFGELPFDAFYMEYDSERAGGFEPLRFVPKGTTVVLGLVNSKVPEVESADYLAGRIEQAARHIPLEQLALSPQCGFASSVGGNPLTAEDQAAKLRRIVEVAETVWR